MSGWFIYKTDRKTSMKATGVIIVIVIISTIIGIFFPHINDRKSNKKGKENKIVIDTMKGKLHRN